MDKNDLVFWKIVSVFAFLVLLIVTSIIADSRWIDLANLSLFWFFILIIATFRMAKLLASDSMTREIREYISKKGEKSPFWKVLDELFSCLWCLGIWAALFALILLVAIPGGEIILIILAIAGIASLIHILSNLIGWYAEAKKEEIKK